MTTQAPATSIWVPLEQLVPHPRNPNRMNEEKFKKFVAAIESSRKQDGTILMPPLIVRSLGNSKEFKEEHEAGKFQILDGEHRWKLRRDEGAEAVECCNWGDLDDVQANKYLLSINELRGSKIQSRRDDLIREMLGAGAAPEALSSILPETNEHIVKLAKENAAPEIKAASEKAKEIGRRKPLTIWVRPEQEDVIRESIEKMYGELDPEHQHSDCREGESLAAICRAFMSGS